MADQWYYTCEGKQMEPVSTDEIKQLAAAGYLKPTDLVWKEGMPKWVRVSAAKEIFGDVGSGRRRASLASTTDDAVEEKASPAERKRRRPRHLEEDEDNDDQDADDDDRPRESAAPAARA